MKKAKRRLEAIIAEASTISNNPLINKNHLDVMSESTRAAIYTLYDYVKPLPHKTGLVFDANSYMEALKLYEERLEDFKSKNS